MKPGDRVEVDLSGIYAALCSGCGSSTLIVPGGTCAHCGAAESEAVPDPGPLRIGGGEQGG